MVRKRLVNFLKRARVREGEENTTNLEMKGGSKNEASHPGRTIWTKKKEICQAKKKNGGQRGKGRGLG